MLRGREARGGGEIRSGRLAGAAVAALLLASCSSGAPTGAPPPTRAAPPPSPAASPFPGAPATASPVAPTSHGTAPAPVLLVVMENREYGSVIDSPQWPYLNSLAARGVSATAMYATTHPSLPNYLELIAGTAAGVADDCTACSVEVPTVVDQLRSRGLDWRAYMEGAPGPCPQVAGGGGYAKKHDPFVYVRHLVADPGACDRVVPFDGFDSAVAAGRLPALIWVGPTLCDDGHDCAGATPDTWLRTTLAPVLASSWYRAGGVVLITWDEGASSSGCCGGASGGRIATVAVSTSIPAGTTVRTPADQAGLLRALERHFGLPPLGDAAAAAAGDLSALLGDAPGGG